MKTTTRVRVLLLFLALTFFSQYAFSQTGKRVSVYVMNGASAASIPAAQWQRITHVYYAFLNPMSNTAGTVTTATTAWFDLTAFNNFVTAAKTGNPNIKIIISTGGAPVSDDITARLNIIFQNAGYRTQMVTDIGNFIQTYNRTVGGVTYTLDGWDLDYEPNSASGNYPPNATIKNGHEALLSEMRTRLNTAGTAMCKKIEMSIAINGEANKLIVDPAGVDYVNPNVINYLDVAHLMTYDDTWALHTAAVPGWPTNHSPLEFAKESVNGFSAAPFNWPKNKLLIGAPFYGRQTSNPANTATYVGLGCGAGNYTTDNNGTYNYNGCPTLTSKVNYILSEGLAGIVIWEGAQDCTGATSLLGCINTALGTNKYVNADRPCCTHPGLGADLTTCSSGATPTLTAAAGGNSYVWYKNGSVIGGATTNTLVSTGVGTYVVTRNQTGIAAPAYFCSKSDTIVITAALPTPELGAATITTCASTYLLTPSNASSYPAGTAWQWYFNGSAISGATTNTLYASEIPGTYRLEANLSGCAMVFDEITLNTAATSASPDNGCSATSPASFTLSVSGGTGPFYWYNSDIPGGTLLQANSATYNTGSLTTGTYYYYVEDQGAATNYSIGIVPPITLTGADWAYLTTDPPTFSNTVPGPHISMEFEVMNPVTIKSVDVYPYGGAPTPFPFRVQIYNSSNSIIFDSGTLTAAAAGWMTISINRNLPKGFYRMRTIRDGGVVPGFFHKAGAVYPYSGTNIRITRTMGVPQYGPFFNWQIADYGTCNRIKVRATVGSPCVTILPVELLNFTATRTGENVSLDWSTASEVNNAYFNIERSSDGINYTVVGQVEGYGNSSEVQTYGFTDVNAPAGKLYYRLAQYDIDGAVSYSQVRTVGLINSLQISVVPNPFNGEARVAIQGMESSVADMKIYDVNGRIVYTGIYNNSEGGITIGAGLESGFYILEVTTNESTAQHKFVKE